LVIGMIVIAAEGVLAAHVLGSWAILYHRFPKPGDPTKRSSLKELALFIACLLLTLVATTTLTLIAGTQFQGFDDFSTDGPVASQVQRAATLAIPGIIYPTWTDVSNGWGFTAAAFSALSYGAYLIIFWEAGKTRLWGPGSRDGIASYTPRMPVSAPASTPIPGHAFISYVHEDSTDVDWLQNRLEASGIRVWRDTQDLWPGQDWRLEIRRAITAGSLAFIACFSPSSQSRVTSYQNEELVLAVDQMRRRPPGQQWLFPVRFGECQLPAYDLGAGRTLDDLQRVDLFGDKRKINVDRLAETIHRLLQSSGNPT